MAQVNDSSSLQKGLASLFEAPWWLLAVPVPLLYVASPQYIFERVDPSYSRSTPILAVFLIVSAVVIPLSLIRMTVTGTGDALFDHLDYIAMLIFGTACATVSGRLVYQKAVELAHGDNGFVAKYFLLIQTFSSTIAWLISTLYPKLRFDILSPMFLLGLALVFAPLALLQLTSRRKT
jgi:hypothetical protein